jgi:farnesyl-diphosphate farnesyltransferase
VAEDESIYERELGGQLLASVSRSFYLTLKALPKQLREPISLAYLLARTADTIADTSQVPAGVRLSSLEQFAGLISGDTNQKDGFVEQLAADFQQHQTDQAEARLMQRASEALQWLASMSGSRLQAIRSVLKHIIDGQRADIVRFPGSGELSSLATASELENYTWQVAGCVGEFWTELCFSEMDEAFMPGSEPQALKELGASYGKGLQLVNILRDLGKDRDLGRCYFPKEEWSALGLTESDVQQSPAHIRPVWEQWAVKADEWLRAGIDYVVQLQHPRLRYATALPVLLGIRTLASLRAASDAELEKGVKIGRLDVAKLLMQVSLNNSPSGIRKLANH